MVTFKIVTVQNGMLTHSKRQATSESALRIELAKYGYTVLSITRV